jgi:4-amino-4-deoxy-L-arabinose transferase-like glycosyltransferase
MAAFLLRAAWLFYKATLIPAVVLATVPFQNEVGNVASAIASGQGFCCLFRQPTGPTAWVAPVYPLVIAALFKLFGTFTLRSFYVAVLLNSAFSALAAIPLFHAAQRFAGTFTAVLAAWLWALFPTGIILPYAWIWDTSLSALLAAAILWATLRLAHSPFPRAYALYGLLWGFSLLTNPSLGALFPFLLAWILFRGRETPWQKLRCLLIACAVILAVCLPWTIRNFSRFHRLIPLRSNLPYEFWSGNNEIFDPESHEVNRITRFEQTGLYARLGESSFLDQKWQDAKSFVRSHPVLYTQLCAQRVVATWLGTASPRRDFLRATAFEKFLLLWNAVAFVAFLVGLARLYLRGRPFFILVAVFPLVFPLAFYLTHTSLRHRHPVDPVLALLMALALRGVGVRTTPEIG